jgi:Na+:H+ antiporter, NhaA family
VVICEHPGPVTPSEDMTPWTSRFVDRVRDPVQEFLATESAGGIALAGAALVAIVWATVATASYAAFWAHSLPSWIGGLSAHLTLQDLAREGLMPIFFFVVGLEVKRELTVGELSDMRVARLPVIAALGGMVVPALIYAAVVHGGPGAGGWGIPMATDIAFVVGALQLLGTRVPTQLKVFMLAIAVVDDIGAIIVIAVWYSHGVRAGWILASVACVVAAWLVLRAGVRWVPLFVVLGIASCLAMAAGGVSPTIDAVVLGLMMPMAPWRVPSGGQSTAPGPTAVERLEHLIHPWSAFVVLPLFALASAGIPLTAEAIRHAATDPIALGVVFGLVIGKPVGVLTATWLAVTLHLGVLPDGLRWSHVACGAALAGIGFTVAIFIATLAFPQTAQADVALIGILAGSMIAALLGLGIALVTGRRDVGV